MEQKLARYPCVIGEKEIWPDGSGEISVINPANGDVIGVVPEVGEDCVLDAVNSSFSAFATWKHTSPAQRSGIMKKISLMMKQQIDSLARTVCEEVGKPIEAAYSEVKSSAELLDYFSDEALRIKGELPSAGNQDEIVMVAREPVGVVAAITPFNYPLSTLICKLGSALAAGCTVVVKPDEHTPISTILIARLALDAGLPPGVLNVITGRGEITGSFLLENPLVRMVTFTGSISTGQIILEKSAKFIRRVVLELGGNCPLIICDGSPWKENIPAIVKQSFKNSGQYCYRINRVYAEKDIYDEFLSEFLKAVKTLKVGCPDDKNSDLGPLNNEKIARRVEEHIKDAVAKGATVECGGERISEPHIKSRLYFPPTVLTNVNHQMLVMTEETFGPVVGIMPVESSEEAVRWANNGDCGLAAYIFAPDVGSGMKIARDLEYGSVWVNTIHQAYFSVPFGGVKKSGLGREKSPFGLDEFFELKTTYIMID